MYTDPVVVWVFLAISYLVTVSERCIGERVVRVSLELDDTIVKDRFVTDVENVGHRSAVSHRESQKL